ncbi:hypothetical protein CVT24_002271 [Panaeolus cyanescens]|uniref:Integrase catalytic domain-containing protein n=1 Tax=Panaeolus cyanescens TaxID=181874 RepID=A0A409WV23_9AGAR|nr:hypothetical protein CVT24_002271 [Panaeolus cyanescens]
MSQTNPSTNTSFSNPPLFPDAEKFDGTNYFSWSSAVTKIARLRGAMGTILPPAPATTETTPDVPPTGTTTTPIPEQTQQTTSTPTTTTLPTPWTSLKPTEEEWDQRDAWALILITFNIKNPVGLGVDIDGTAADAWRSLETQYRFVSEIAVVNAENELRNLRYIDGNDLNTHLADLRMRWTYANSIGASINDRDFRMIVIQSLPASWDHMVTTLYTSPTSADTIARLRMHWDRVNRQGIGRSSSSSTASATIALPANTNTTARFQLRCTNSNCKRRGHTIENCYWRGGGKEGQFPPGFGKRGGGLPSAQGQSNATSTTSGTIANVAMTETAFALMAIGGGDEEGDVTIGNADMVEVMEDPRVEEITDEGIVRALMADAVEVEFVTYADSGASDHCFVNKSDFSTYEAFDEPRLGQAANRGMKFRIVGKGSVTKTFFSEGKKTTLTFNNALHTPDFAANLISVSRFESNGFSVLFKDGAAIFRDKNDNPFISAPRVNGMYILSAKDVTFAMPVKSHSKPTTIDTWHRRFAHAGLSGIKEIKSKGLVDGLDVTEGVKELGGCEDCVYGKQTRRPFDGKGEMEKELLERVHVDLWGPARVQSVGGAKYLMILTDGASSYRVAYTLADKSAETVLALIKRYKAMAEKETGKKLKCLRLDMGKEFYNRSLESF